MSRLRITKACLLVLACAGLLWGCRRSDNLDPAPGYEIELIVFPFPAVVGHTHLNLKLTGPDGQPVQGALITARGDMTHPGMTPVLTETTELGDGRYEAALEWTMAGDWVVTIRVELPEGLLFERTFEISVAGDGGMDHDT